MIISTSISESTPFWKGDHAFKCSAALPLAAFLAFRVGAALPCHGGAVRRRRTGGMYVNTDVYGDGLFEIKPIFEFF